MSKEQFEALIPYISADLVKLIAEKENISHDDAILRLYSSKLYEMLENEETKIWQYSTHMLYSLLKQEEETGTIIFPDV